MWVWACGVFAGPLWDKWLHLPDLDSKGSAPWNNGRPMGAERSLSWASLKMARLDKQVGKVRHFIGCAFSECQEEAFSSRPSFRQQEIFSLSLSPNSPRNPMETRRPWQELTNTCQKNVSCWAAQLLEIHHSAWREIQSGILCSHFGPCPKCDELSELRLFVFSKAVPQVMIDKSTLWLLVSLHLWHEGFRQCVHAVRPCLLSLDETHLRAGGGGRKVV